MDNMVLANVLARPMRSASSVVGIALGVVLILVTVGLARGMLLSSGEREGNLRAELLFLPPSGFGAGVSTSPLTLPVAYATALADMPGVAKTTPVARYVRSGARGIGFELIEGIEIEPGATASYPELTDMSLASGRWPTGRNDLLVDVQRSQDPETALGASVELLGETFTVVGVYEPEVGARMKIPLNTMQDLLGAADRASWILIKTEEDASVATVAEAIESKFSGNQIVFSRDIPGLWAQGIPSLEVFLNVVVGLSVVISTLTIFLALYTAITERTREIGILKAMGGSKRFIVSVIETEALVLSVLGVGLGVAAAVAIKWVVMAQTSLVVQFEWQWLGAAASMAILGGTLGALYPALKAAHQDPVEALSYE